MAKKSKKIEKAGENPLCFKNFENAGVTKKMG